MAIHDREEQFEKDEAIRAESVALLVWVSDLLGEGIGHDDRELELAEQWMVDRYRIEALLGSGGSSAVFRAVDSRSGESVALKLPSLSVVADPEWTRRFVEEARIVKELVHPGIVAVRDFGKFGLVHFIAFELIKGPTLAEWAAKGRPVSPEMAAEIIRCVAGTIHHAHERGIIHRDLKPSNILLGSGTDHEPLPFWPMVTDFGLAHRPRSVEVSLHTGESVILGTDPYLSPEQAAGNAQAVTEASDVFSMGVILYELLAGRRPFDGADAAQTREKIRAEDPPPIRKLRPGVPRNLETIILKCLEKSPERRYPSARDLADDLACFLTRKRIRARRPSLARQARKFARRRPLFVGLTAVCAMGAMVVVTLTAAWLVDRARSNREFVAVKSTTDKLAYAESLHKYDSSIRQAAEAFERGHREEVFRSLGDCRALLGSAEKCGIEWRILWSQANAAERRFVAHPSGVIGVRYSPVAPVLATGGKDGRVIFWNTETWRQIRTIEFAASAEVAALEFSPDGSLLAVGGEDGRLAVYRVADAGCMYDEATPARRVFTLAWIDNGKRIAVGGDSATLLTVDPIDGARRTKVLTVSSEGKDMASGHPTEISALLFLPKRNILAVFLTPFTMRFVDPATLEAIGPDISEAPNVGAVCSLDEGQDFILATVKLGTLGLWDAGSGLRREVFTFPGHIRAMRHSVAAGIVAMGFEDGAIGTLNAKALVDGNVVATHRRSAHDGRTTTMDFSPDGEWLVSGGVDGAVNVWQSTQINSDFDLELPGAPWRVEFSPCGRWLAVTVEAIPDVFRIMVLDAKTFREVWSTVSTHRLSYETSAFGPTGEELAMVDGSSIVVLDIRDGKRIAEFPVKAEQCVALSYSPDGKSIIARNSYAAAMVVERSSGLVRERIAGPPDDCLGQFRTARGDSWLLTSDDRQLTLIRQDTAEDRLNLAGPVSRIRMASVSADGQKMAAGSLNGTIYWWELNSPNVVHSLVGHSDSITSLCFSPDAERILSASSDGTMRVWRLAGGVELLRYGSPNSPVVSSMLDQTGTTLVLGMSKGQKSGLKVFRLGTSENALAESADLGSSE